MTLSTAYFAAAQHNLDNAAVKADDARISQWAATCVVERGWLDIADKAQGYASAGADQNATGPLSGTSPNIVSLGDSGVAVMTFAVPIRNADGPDFAVFENGFLDPTDSGKAFLELAFVEVSSDGVHYVRFPAYYNGPDTAQVTNFTYVKGQDYVNLAGRYIHGYGTPFDLEELQDSAAVDINNITHIRIVDVIGSLDPAVGSKDAAGRMINDPYATAFASGGFDLTGVAVLNATPSNIAGHNDRYTLTLSPNPVADHIVINADKLPAFYYQIVNINGAAVLQGNAGSGTAIGVSGLPAGVYYCILKYGNTKRAIKFVKQ
ncbi:MAG: T9SS type A sorting domain-containing protein [Sphingobacteriales bacterium]|nr:MAG: T9SS type A sorting domain-containing protein [Sphingobacteriales bacterium]